ncbi:chemotaxis protein CheW, partial [Aeromonas caviae]|uniref:chemotaxis protein CheW n=1 Tax=Aeromonas caviae TaxID=648 RepID=UPI0029D68818
GTLKVKEIVPYTQLTALPQSHPTVLGAASMRGTTIPVIDMAMAVGGPPPSRGVVAPGVKIKTQFRPPPGGGVVGGGGG